MNYSAEAPLWNWNIVEVQKLKRYTWPEIETKIFIPSRDSSPSEVERYLSGNTFSSPTNVYALREYRIVMASVSRFQTTAALLLVQIFLSAKVFIEPLDRLPCPIHSLSRTWK